MNLKDAGFFTRLSNEIRLSHLKQRDQRLKNRRNFANNNFFWMDTWLSWRSTQNYRMRAWSLKMRNIIQIRRPLFKERGNRAFFLSERPVVKWTSKFLFTLINQKKVRSRYPGLWILILMWEHIFIQSIGRPEYLNIDGNLGGKTDWLRKVGIAALTEQIQMSWMTRTWIDKNYQPKYWLNEEFSITLSLIARRIKPTLYSDDVDRFILTDTTMRIIPAIRNAPAHMNSGIAKS